MEVFGKVYNFGGVAKDFLVDGSLKIFKLVFLFKLKYFLILDIKFLESLHKCVVSIFWQFISDHIKLFLPIHTLNLKSRPLFKMILTLLFKIKQLMTIMLRYTESTYFDALLNTQELHLLFFMISTFDLVITFLISCQRQLFWLCHRRGLH